MKRLIILLVSFVLSIIIGISVGLNIPSPFEVFPNWSKFNVFYSIFYGFILAVIVVTAEIIVFSIIDKKKIKENKQKKNFI